MADGWACLNCGVVNNDGASGCYACGADPDGVVHRARVVEAAEPPQPVEPSERALDCPRCSTPMSYAGRRRFHEGSQAAPFLLGDFGEAFVRREVFDLYACEACGKVELFLPPDR